MSHRAAPAAKIATSPADVMIPSVRYQAAAGIPNILEKLLADCAYSKKYTQRISLPQPSTVKSSIGGVALFGRFSDNVGLLRGADRRAPCKADCTINRALFPAKKTGWVYAWSPHCLVLKQAVPTLIFPFWLWHLTNQLSTFWFHRIPNFREKQSSPARP